MTNQLITNLRRGGYEQASGRMIMVAASELERTYKLIKEQEQEIAALTEALGSDHE